MIKKNRKNIRNIYIKEFNMFVGKKINNNGILNLLESLNNLEENTDQLRYNLNNNILKKIMKQ